MSIQSQSATGSDNSQATMSDLANDGKLADQKSALSLDENGETAEESETPENEEESQEDSESEDKKSDDEKPKKNGFKKRVDKLNKRLSEKERELEYWKQQALKSGANNQEPQQKQTPKVEVATEKPKAEDFDTHAEYLEAIADWKAEQKFLERDQRAKAEQLRAEQQKQVSTFQDKVEKFKESHDDFDDLLEDIDDIPMSVAVQEVVLGSENGPELMYELAKNREEYARICALPAAQAYVALGKFAAKLEASSSDASKQEIKTTKAPAPLKPVGTKSGTVKKSVYDPNLSFAEYERIRREQLKLKS